MTDRRSGRRAAVHAVEQRSLAFYVAPFLVLTMLLALLAFEVLRGFLPAEDQASLPTVLGVAPTSAAVLTVAALLLGRSQYAFANRPMFGAGSDGLDDAGQWSVRIFNGGPGHAQLRSLTYSLSLERAGEVKEFQGEFSAALAALKDGLVEDRDFSLVELSPGTPLPPVKSASDGLLLVSLGAGGRRRLTRLEVHISYVDIVGDRRSWRRDFAPIYRRLVS